MAAVVFDTETTGRYVQNARPDNPAIAKLVQLGAILIDTDDGTEIASVNTLVYPDRWEIGEEVSKIHGITQSRAKRFGVGLENACYIFRDMIEAADEIVAHNISYDDQVMQHAFYMAGLEPSLIARKKQVCTMRMATNIVKAPSKNGRGGYKWPTLTECVKHFFDEDLIGAHDAMIDVRACGRIYLKMQEMHP